MSNVFLTTKDLKKRYGIKSPKTFVAWRKKRGFPNPVCQSQGSTFMYDIKDILAWEEKQKQAA